jgi:hypothetical protein
MGKAVKRKFAIGMQKIASSSHPSPEASPNLFIALGPQVRLDHIWPGSRAGGRHAIANAARFALPWKRVESNGHVIGFVISFLAPMR